MKNSFLKNYKALIIAGIITIGLAIKLIGGGAVNTPYLIISNIFLFIFIWLGLSFLMHQFSVYKVLGLLGLLFTALFADRYIGIFNPITIPLVILFWLGVAYLIIPQFFKKYQIAILSIYGVILSYFFIFRMMPNFQEDHLQTLLNLMTMPIPVFAALWGYEQWRWLKTLQADKGKAEVALLKSQINPHFFFNTLNNLYGLALAKSDKAPEVILKLSDMMRYTIYEGKEDVVLLKDEINYLENYIELHKIRYQKKVEILFTHDVEEGLKVAPLLFIILLENAFKHGVEKMREHAFIHLQMQSQGNQLFFTIENNFDEPASSHPPGIGLDNLKQRLAYLYPNQHELIIEKKEAIYKAQLNLEL